MNRFRVPLFAAALAVAVAAASATPALAKADKRFMIDIDFTDPANPVFKPHTGAPTDIHLMMGGGINITDLKNVDTLQLDFKIDKTGSHTIEWESVGGATDKGLQTSDDDHPTHVKPFKPGPAWLTADRYEQNPSNPTKKWIRACIATDHWVLLYSLTYLVDGTTLMTWDPAITNGTIKPPFVPPGQRKKLQCVMEGAAP